MKKMVKKWNRNAKIYITLEGIREFKVRVIGQIKQPGLYDVTGITRISDLYQIILNIENEIKKLEAEKEDSEKQIDPNFNMTLNQKSQISDLYERKIKKPKEEDEKYRIVSNRNLILHRNNEKIRIDLALYGVTGRDELNPYLQQGDILEIPLRSHEIGIYGGIKMPGKYEFVSGESLNKLMLVAGGLRPDANTDEIEITRYNSPITKFSFPVNNEESEKIILSPEDHIMVKYSKQYKRQEVVHISGEITYPGVYTIEPGRTTIGDILSKAGGYTERSDSSKITINNRSIYDIPDRELERILLIPEENRASSERAYIKARMMTQKGALETNSYLQAQYVKDFLLAKNDILYVPENFEYVEILGAIHRPGRYPFTYSQSFNDYIKLAGGITSNATRNKYVIKAGTGQRLRLKNNSKIDTGDTIFIAEKMEYNRWLALKDALSTASSVAVLLYYFDRVLQN
jgi:protein involved in polysaccharide export with SLBB domain